MAICIGRFGMSLLEAKRCTPVDYEIYTKGHAVRLQEEVHLIHLQAWANQASKAVKGKGKNMKSAYRNFDDFYNNEKHFCDLFREEKPEEKLTSADLNRLLNQKRKEDVHE